MYVCVYKYIIYVETPALTVLLLDTWCRGATPDDWKALPIRDNPSCCIH